MPSDKSPFPWYDYIGSAVLCGEISYAVNLYNDRINVTPAISDRIITVNDIHADTPSIIIDFKSEKGGITSVRGRLQSDTLIGPRNEKNRNNEDVRYFRLRAWGT